MYPRHMFLFETSEKVTNRICIRVGRVLISIRWQKEMSGTKKYVTFIRMIMFSHLKSYTVFLLEKLA